MSQACPERLGDIGAYIVGALDRNAGADVRGHLSMCSGCRAEYQDLLPVREWLGGLAGETSAGADPESRLRQATAEAAAASERACHDAPPVRPAEASITVSSEASPWERVLLRGDQRRWRSSRSST
jgi:hypothetical protein